VTAWLAAPAEALGDKLAAVRARIGRRRMRTLDIGLRAGFVVALVLFAIYRPMMAADAHAYWAVDISAPYTRPIATTDAFTYPPPAALAFSVLGHLPWPVFQALWTILIGLALLWMAGPWSILFLAVPVVSSDLYLGNIHLLLAAAIVAAFRWPALWAFALLTKPTCGVGLLWFLVRGEWRAWRSRWGRRPRSSWRRRSSLRRCGRRGSTTCSRPGSRRTSERPPGCRFRC